MPLLNILTEKNP